jgi:hypothetical protein
MTKLQRHSTAQSRNAQQHQREVGGGPGERHPCRAPRVTPLPQRIVRSAGPANHSSALRNSKAKNREQNHSIERPLNVRKRVQAELTAQRRRGVAADFRRQRVRCFMARRRKKENDIPDETHHQ